MMYRLPNGDRYFSSDPPWMFALLGYFVVGRA